MSLTYLILNYNNKHYLSECVDNALKIVRDNDELFIVDDNSTDGSWALIMEYSKREGVSCFRNKSNLGMYTSVKSHLDFVKTDYLTIIDSDDIINYPLSEFIKGKEVVRYMFQLIHGNDLNDDSFLYPGREFDLDQNLSALGSILKYGNYVGSTTSGNVYKTETLKKLTKRYNFSNSGKYFDAPSFDGFVHRKIAFEGPVVAHNLVVGLYRRHDNNNGSKYSMFSIPKIKRSILVINTDKSYLYSEYGVTPSSLEAIFWRDKRILTLSLLGDLLRLNLVSYAKKVFMYFLWFNKPKPIIQIFKAHLIFLKSSLWT